MNKSWTRVPSVLQSATKTFSTQSEKESVTSFQSELKSKNQLGNLESTFNAMVTVIDKNIKWREQNENQIINWINENHNSSIDSTSTETMSTGTGSELTTDAESTTGGTITLGISGLFLLLSLM